MASVRISDSYRNMLDEIVKFRQFSGEECSISSLAQEALDTWGIREKYHEVRTKKKRIASILLDVTL